MKRYISMMKQNLIVIGLLVSILFPSGEALSEAVKTEELKAIEGREVLDESALSLPKGSNRISISTQYSRGIGKGFEVGTNVLSNIVGFFNADVGYNFWRNDQIALKFLTTATLDLGKETHLFSLLTPEVRATFFNSPIWHQHFLISYNKLRTGSDIFLDIGLGPTHDKENLTPSKSLHFMTVSEFRLFANNKYSGSILAQLGDIHKGSDGKVEFGVGGAYLWAWENFHLRLGVNYESGRSSKLTSGHVIPNAGLYWTF